jgi:uncharacterized protein
MSSGQETNPIAQDGGNSPHTLRLMTGETFRRAIGASVAWLEKHVDLINSLNVFPVPDGDTGTNMYLTMRAAYGEIADLPALTVSNVAGAASHGALMGARGNSGVILSQILRGMAKVMDEMETVDASGFARSLQEGAATAYKGVMKPVEGTILTVVREAAEAAATAAAEVGDLMHVLEATVKEAAASVQRTPTLLADLRDAGVVDSGGQGLYTILDGMLRHLRGEEIELGKPMLGFSAPELVMVQEFGYEALFVLQGANLPVDQIRAKIMAMGDSVLVVGDAKILKIHVHTGRPGAVLDYAISVGNISDVVVENLQAQTEAFSLQTTQPEAPQSAVVACEALADVAIVAVASGEGLQAVFQSLGASAVVNGGQTTNPSTEELLQAINALTTRDIIILPNNSNVIMAAEQAKQLCDRNVQVVPTKTVPQGISALIAFNYQADIETNVKLMTQAKAEIQTGEITLAVRSALVNGLHVEEGQVLGLLNGDMVSVGEEIEAVVQDLLTSMEADEYEIITIYYGQDVTEAEAEDLAAAIEAAYPDAEIEVVGGSQPHYMYIISAE